MLRNAAEQKACQAAPSPLADDDQVDGFALRDVEDERGGIAEPGNGLNPRDADRLRPFLGAQQDLAGARFEDAADVIANVQGADGVIEDSPARR